MQSLLLGPTTWQIHNDSKFCSTEEIYTRTLILSSCSQDEFSCNDGSCVKMEVRCDGRMDCRDKSDEEECRYLIPTIGYDKFLVPPPMGDEKTTLINMTMNIENIDIDEVDGFIRTKFTLNRVWFDSQLTFQNLRNDSKNSLYPEDKEIIWKPWIQFENIQNYGKIQKTDQLDDVAIALNSNYSYKHIGITHMYNALLFEGSENALNYERQLTVDWICELGKYHYVIVTFRYTRLSTFRDTFTAHNLSLKSIW